MNANKGVEILDWAYDKCLNGIPKVSKPVEELANDYISKYGQSDLAIKKMINNQLNKNTINGFISGLGGFTTMAVSLPANITSVTYVQMRMIAVIAIIRGYNLRDDEVQTFVYACLAGGKLADIFKGAGIKFGNKLGTSLIGKISGKTLTKINQKIGFRFITKFGTKGIINLGKGIPLIGGGIGSAIDFTATKQMSIRAMKFFGNDNAINLDVFE